MKLEPAQKMRQRDRLLEDFAFGLHAGDLRGSVADGAFETDAIARAAKVIMSRTGSSDPDQAEEQARAVFSFSEEIAGLLVRKAPSSVGFLHRSLQEYFAGSHLAQLSLPDRIAFIKTHAGHAVWKEPILYLLFLVRNEQEVGLLVDAIDQTPVNDVAEQAVSDALLTEAAFADFAHDIPKAQRLVQRLFSETELNAWGARQRALLGAAVDGLFSQSVSAQCAEKLAEWMPDYHGWGRAGAILAMQKWDKALRPACVPLLIRVLAGDLENAWRAAGSVLGEFARGDEEVKKTLLRLVHEPRSAETLHGALFALGQGCGKDADVAALAAELRHAQLPDIQIDAIRIRAGRGEADVSDLEIFAALAFHRDRFISRSVAPDLVEYFASRHKPELLASLEPALEETGRSPFDIPLLSALIAVEPAHRLVEPRLRQLLAENWSIGELFGRSNASLERVSWTPELVRAIEDNLTKEKHFDADWYWVGRVLKLPSMKERMIASMKAGDGLTFWSSKALAEFWGRKDAEVCEAFKAMLDAPAFAFAKVAADAAIVIDDRPAVRKAILRSLLEKPPDTRFLLDGLRRLGIGAEDDEAFNASYDAGDPKRRFLNDNQWRESMFRTFGARPEVREMARAEVTIRDGNIDAVAEVYAGDRDICERLMKVIAPLPDAARLSLVLELGAAAPSNPMAFKLLAEARRDTHGATAAEAVMAWTDACVARNTFGKDERDFLADELEAVGAEFKYRRAAAVAGLAITDNLAIFANLKDYQGKLQDVHLCRLGWREESDRCLKRVLACWGRVTSALGGEEAALTRLGLSPEDTFAVLNPGTPNAERVFLLLDARATSRQLDRLRAMQRFAPDSPAMRKLIEPLLLQRGSTRRLPRSNSEAWPAMIAAEIFADHFAQSELRQLVIDLFISDPESDCAAAALAETALRERDASLEELLREKAKGVQYELVTSLRIMAAIGNIVDPLEWLFKEYAKEPALWNCSYWVPAFLRRIERDEQAADEIIKALDHVPSSRLSKLALLGLGCKDKAKTRRVLGAALRDYETPPVPVIAFDVTANAYRLAAHAVRELLV